MGEFHFTAKLWLWDGPASWHFVTLPTDVADEIRRQAEGLHLPFGTLKVEAASGSSRWKTALFSDTKRGSYLLPVKAAVRTKEQLRLGDEMEVLLRIA